MKVYEFMQELAKTPAGAEVFASPGGGEGSAMGISYIIADDEDTVRVVLDGSYEDHIESEE